MSERFSAAFLDFDGVLVDTEPIWWGEIEHELRVRGLPGVGDPSMARPTGLRLDDALSWIAEHSGWSRLLVNDIAARVRSRVEPRIEAMPLRDSMRNAVIDMAAAGVVVGVVSSSATELLGRFLRNHELEARVSVVVGGNRVRVGKPDPACYELATREAGVPPSRCCALEDSETGARAARAAGVFVVRYMAAGVGAGAGAGDFDSDHEVSSLEEFADFVLDRSP